MKLIKNYLQKINFYSQKESCRRAKSWNRDSFGPNERENKSQILNYERNPFHALFRIQ